jgi:hypothetical protein
LCFAFCSQGGSTALISATTQQQDTLRRSIVQLIL